MFSCIMSHLDFHFNLHEYSKTSSQKQRAKIFISKRKQTKSLASRVRGSSIMEEAFEKMMIACSFSGRTEAILKEDFKCLITTKLKL